MLSSLVQPPVTPLSGNLYCPLPITCVSAFSRSSNLAINFLRQHFPSKTEVSATMPGVYPAKDLSHPCWYLLLMQQLVRTQAGSTMLTRSLSTQRVHARLGWFLRLTEETGHLQGQLWVYLMTSDSSGRGRFLREWTRSKFELTLLLKQWG